MRKLTCVLLVDDNYAINLLHKKILLNLGVTAHFHMAKHGEDALQYIEEALRQQDEAHPKPDLILMDINMPRMNGWEFLEEYRQRNYMAHDFIIAFLTTSPNPDDERKAFNIPEIADYLQKPLATERMQSLLEKHFDQFA